MAGHIQPFIMALTVPGFGWDIAAGIYSFALLATAVLLTVPARLRSALGFALTSLGITALPLAAVVPPELMWFGPLLLIKLLLAHVPPPVTA